MPPTQDQVSLDAAAVLGTVATGGPGSLIAALDSGIVQIESLIAGLRSDLNRYRATDQAAMDDLA